MKVILNQTVPKVGKQGQIVTVKDGFARNYLFPRGLAIVAEKNQVAALEKRHSRLAERDAAFVSQAEGTRSKLDGHTVRIEGKVGAAAGKLFGAITSQDIADAIRGQLGVDIDKKQVALIEPIKRLGVHKVELDLHRLVDAVVLVDVFDPAAPVEEAPATEPVQVESATESAHASEVEEAVEA